MEEQILKPVVRIEGAFTIATIGLCFFNLLRAALPVFSFFNLYPLLSNASPNNGEPENFPSMHNIIDFICLILFQVSSLIIPTCLDHLAWAIIDYTCYLKELQMRVKYFFKIIV